MDTKTLASPATPYATVADIVRSLPDDIDRLADGLGYPMNSVHEARERLHEIAATMRAHLPVEAARHG